MFFEEPLPQEEQAVLSFDIRFAKERKVINPSNKVKIFPNQCVVNVDQECFGKVP